MKLFYIKFEDKIWDMEVKGYQLAREGQDFLIYKGTLTEAVNSYCIDNNIEDDNIELIELGGKTNESFLC